MDELFAAGGKRADERVGVEVGADRGQHRARAGAEGGAIEKTCVTWQITEAEIFGDREIGAEREFLVDHRDAELAGGERRSGRDCAALEQNLAGIRRVNAGKNFPERALAGAVFTDERVARAALDGERNLVER